MHRTLLRSFVAGTLLALIALVGCSSDGDDDSTCEDLQALAADVRTLADVDLSAGSEALSDDLDQVDQAWQQARETAGSQFGDELDALEQAIQQLTTTFDDLGDAGVGESVDALRQDIGAVSDAWDALADAVEGELSGCDLSAG